MNNIRHDWTIATSLSGRLYFDLLRWCSERAEWVGFTVSPNGELSGRAKALLRASEARGAIKKVVTQWPGTILHSGEAVMYTLPASANLNIILPAANDLFSWQEPDLPEDLFFLRADGTPLLATIAHEKDAYLSLDKEEVAQLKKDLPQLVPLLVSPSSRTSPEVN